MKKIIKFLIISLTISTMGLWATPTPNIPAAKKASNDESEYRRFTLDNGLKVILLSDPKFNKSSAALAVSVGSLSDPEDRQGLAHFLEHMLFLGTEKYPDEAEYGNYLKTNGGYNNAYTSSDHTNYHFEIRHEAFEGALDRMAQFFIAPLFTPKFTEREINAVNSEFQKNLESDMWRRFQLHCSHYPESHPANHFNIGSRETLGGTTQEELLAFHRAHYSANTMTLAVTGKASLDQLESWVRTYYAPIENRQLETPRFDSNFSPAKPALRLIRMEPVKDLRSLSLQFALPATTKFYASKPGQLLGSILGDEGAGSLLSVLKSKDLATGLSAGSYDESPDYGMFNISISLTPEGLTQYHRVLEIVFGAIHQIKAADYPTYLFQERQAMAALDETYANKGEGSRRAVSLANQLRDYPMEIAEREPYLWLDPDPTGYNLILDHLRPDNALICLVAKGIETDQVEPYYGTKFNYTETSGDDYNSLLESTKVDGFHLPTPNPFIPSHSEMLPIEPIHLIDEPSFSLYYAQDTEFLRPMVTQVYRFRLPRSLATLENSVLLNFYQACVNEALNETTYPARGAGLNFAIAAALEGVSVTVSGYDASADRLLDVITQNLVSFELSEERFLALKDQLVRGLQNFPLSDAHQQVRETSRTELREFYFPPQDQLPLAQKMSLNDVKNFARSLFAHGKIEAMIHGNVSADDALTSARRVQSALDPQPLPDDQLLRRRLLTIDSAENLVSNQKLAGNNSAFRRQYIMGTDDAETRAAALVLSNFIGEPFYSEMRTRQQLGYIVWGGTYSEGNRNYASFIIQSGDYPADEVQLRADAMINQLPTLLSELSDQTWAMIVAGVRSELEQKDKAIADRTGRLFNLAYDRKEDWDRNRATLTALEQLTKARAQEILAETIAPETRRMATYFGFARDHEPAQEINSTYKDSSVWKKTRKFE
jgi:insulysin